MSYHYDFAVFIGRFQPFHAGHLHIVEEGLRRADRLIVLIGSSWQPRNPRNPWTHDEREQMIRACLPPDVQDRVLCAPVMDVPHNDELWVRHIQATVSGIVASHHAASHQRARVALVGHKKDDSGFYLGLFPQWASVGVPNHREISATPLRDGFFAAAPDGVAAYLGSLVQAEVLPSEVARLLEHWAAHHPDYAGLREEMAFVRKYREAWASAPYPPVFVTVDAVVVQSGHVLLVERRARPGKGLFALPGGFVDQGERLMDACLRELREETRLKVPLPVLRGSIKAMRVYDDPHRSARGRTITHAFHIELERQRELPRVVGGDDAARAFWLPLGELDPQRMFEDHYFILQDLLGTS
jgi:bifunctional NMN adenylyltransferase/nudix hydrolase